MCVYEFLWTCEKPVRDENSIYSSTKQPDVMEPGDTVTISSVGMSTLQTYRVAKQHPEMHLYLGTWASIMQNFSCLPSQFDSIQPVYACSARHQPICRSGALAAGITGALGMGGRCCCSCPLRCCLGVPAVFLRCSHACPSLKPVVKGC